MNKITTTLIVIIVIGSLLFAAVIFYPRIGKTFETPVKLPQAEESRRVNLAEVFPNNLKFEQKTLNPCIGDDLKGKPIPTNRIWSSAVFNCKLQGLFTFPLAFQSTNTSLQISLPEVKVADRFFYSDLNQAKLDLAVPTGISKTVVSDFSDLSIKVDFLDSKNSVSFQATFIQGSPYVYFTNVKVPIKIGASGLVLKNKDSLTFQQEGKEGGLIVFSDSGFDYKSNNEINLNTKNNDKFSIGFFDKKEDIPVVEKYANNFVDSVSASYEVTQNEVNTIYNFNYAENSSSKETLFGLLPHQYGTGQVKSLLKANTVRGQQLFVSVSDSYKVATPQEAMVTTLPIDKLTVDEKNLLIDTLKKEVTSVQTIVDTSYFGGKNVAKIGRLIETAELLGQDTIKTNLINTLKNELTNWFTYSQSEESKYFSYDTTVGGLIANKSEFDSANYNDHHFHYGYFIYASAILARYDKDFVQNYGKFVNLIIDDIAYDKSALSEGNFPKFRVFDFYEGHSWASGYGLFSDGNNQESTSEAINAWYSIWLWGKETNDEEKIKSGKYLYSMEVNSANEYWLNRPVDGVSNFPSDYKQDITSIVWGGKADFTTWFSPQPLDIYGIQFLPFTSGSVYLYDKDYILRDYKKLSVSIERKEGKLLDLNVMYLAMALGKKVLPESELSKISIDDGNSQLNFYYWLYFWDKVDSVKTVNQPSGPGVEISYKDKSKAILK